MISTPSYPEQVNVEDNRILFILYDQNGALSFNMQLLVIETIEYKGLDTMLNNCIAKNLPYIHSNKQNCRMCLSGVVWIHERQYTT